MEYHDTDRKKDSMGVSYQLNTYSWQKGTIYKSQPFVVSSHPGRLIYAQAVKVYVALAPYKWNSFQH